MTFLYKNSFHDRSIEFELKSKFDVNKIGPKSDVVLQKSLFGFVCDKLTVSEFEKPLIAGLVRLSARHPSINENLSVVATESEPLSTK